MDKYKIGQKVEFWITGMIRHRQGEVVDFDRFGYPILQAYDKDGNLDGWNLKEGDYVIMGGENRF